MLRYRCHSLATGVTVQRLWRGVSGLGIGRRQTDATDSTPQTNSSDCGVFATAYAVELMTGNVSGVQAPFDVVHMQAHLEVCLEARELTSFPRDLQRQPGRRRKVIKLTVTECGVVSVN